MDIEKLVVKISADIQGLTSALKDAGIIVDEATKTIKDKTKDAADTAKKESDKAGTGIKNTLSKIGSAAKKPMDKLKGIFKESFNKIKGMFEQAFTFGILSKKFAEFGEIVNNYVGNNEALNSSLSQLKGAFLTAVQPLIETVIPILEKVVNKLTGALNVIGNFTTKLTGRTISATKEEAKAMEQLGKASKLSAAGFDELNTLSSAETTTETDYSAVAETQVSMIDMIKEAWTGLLGFIEDISVKVTNLIANIDWGKVGQDAINGVLQLINSISNIIAKIDWYKLGKDIVDLIFKILENLFNGNIGTALGRLAGTILAAVVQLIAGIGEKIYRGIENFIAKCKTNGFWKTLGETAYNLFVLPLVKMFQTFWDSLPDGFKNAFKKAGNFVIDILNGILSGFAKVINAIISGLNKISITLPDWLGGKKFGINIQPMEAKQIPKLATGGIINKPTTVMAGESGAEAVLPLENNTGWMDKLANVFAEKLVDNSETKVVLNIDGNQLGWTTIKNINSITKQTGSLQLALN